MTKLIQWRTKPWRIELNGDSIHLDGKVEQFTPVNAIKISVRISNRLTKAVAYIGRNPMNTSTNLRTTVRTISGNNKCIAKQHFFAKRL